MLGARAGVGGGPQRVPLPCPNHPNREGKEAQRGSTAQNSDSSAPGGGGLLPALAVGSGSSRLQQGRLYNGMKKRLKLNSSESIFGVKVGEGRGRWGWVCRGFTLRSEGGLSG